MGSSLDAVTSFLNRLFGSNQTPDGYLIYLLVMCGLFVIGLVLIYNWWEEKRFNEQVEKSFSPIKNDALLDQNKKQFLDKFAATTGYLSDAPDAASFSVKNTGAGVTAEIDTEKSIDDVYSELLDTMSKRSSQKSKPDDFNIPNMMVEPKDAPIIEDTSSELMMEQVEPAQHSAIKSIIDQVFKNKTLLTKEIKNELKNEEPLVKTALPIKDESVLDAFLSAKNAMDLQENLTDLPKAEETSHFETLKSTTIVNDEWPLVTENNGNSSAEMIDSSLASSISNESDLANENPAMPEEKKQDDSLLPNILNAQMDLIGVLELSSGAAFSLLVDSFSALYKDFDKPVFVHVQDAKKRWLLVNDTTAQKLAEVIDISLPQKIVCSLQLADRSGAVSRNMINRFQLAFDAIAANMGGKVEWQNEGDAFSQAMALDAFCIEVDKTMFFHLTHESTGPFTGTKLRGIAESQGMVLGNDGTFKYFDNEAADAQYPEFVMFNRDNHPFNPEMLRTSVVKAVTFQLDIPHTKSNAKALDRMVLVAKTLEVGLNAVLVDDHNRSLGDLQIDKIRDQIKSIHATMQLRGITPGSEYAHRLFS